MNGRQRPEKVRQGAFPGWSGGAWGAAARPGPDTAEQGGGKRWSRVHKVLTDPDCAVRCAAHSITAVAGTEQALRPVPGIFDSVRR